MVIVKVLLAPPTKMGFWLNVHWLPEEQERVMAPVKLVGPLATMTKVVWSLPMIVGFTALGEESVKAAAPIPVSATVWGLPAALSLMLNVALRVLLAVGVNHTSTTQL